MERYFENGICQYIKRQSERGVGNNLFFYDISRSLLIIANKRNNEPLALLIDDRVKEKIIEFTDEELKYADICLNIARKANLPLFWVKYKDVEILTNEDEVLFWEDTKQRKFLQIKMKELERFFRERNLECSLTKKTPQKWKNDSLSSAFHIWQRDCFTIGVFTDLDLIRMDNNEIKEIIELKRSFVELDSWHPFNNDMNNFAIILNLCKRLGNIPFHIIYNKYVNGYKAASPNQNDYYIPFKKDGQICYDIVDRLKVFNVERHENVFYYPLPYPVFEKYTSIDNLLLG